MMIFWISTRRLATFKSKTTMTFETHELIRLNTEKLLLLASRLFPHDKYKYRKFYLKL